MSFLIKNAKFVNRKVTPRVITFEANENKFTTVLCCEKNLLKTFKNVLQGKYLVKNGVFKIDNYDKVNKPWTSKRVQVIKQGTFFRKWPEKFWLYTSLLLNKDFYSSSKRNYINDKYSYLSFSTSKNNKTDLETREKVETMISRFIDNSIEIEEQWLAEFLEQIVSFNDKNLNKEYSNLEEHIKIIIKDYYYLIEKNLTLELYQTFLQSIWDKVYAFMELNSLCTCEYNAKKSKEKTIKKIASQLNFHQINFVVRKQLKIIDLKVNSVKRKISKNQFILKNLKKQIIFEFGKLNTKFKKLKDLDDLFIWRKASLDQVYEFKQKQEKMFFEGLSDEATILRGKIVEVMHKYHKRILNNDVEQGNFDEFKFKKNELKSSIRSIYKQALEYIEDTSKKLEISFDFITLKWIKISKIWFQLLTAIYLKKYNIIFYDIFSKLSSEETYDLLKAIKNLSKINKKFSIIFLETDLKMVTDLTSKINLINEESISEISYSDILKKYWNTYGNEFFHLGNMVPYLYDGKKMELLNETIKIQSSIFKNSGQLLLDPLKMYTHKRESKNIIFQLQGNVEISNDFIDKNVYQLVLEKNKTKIFFYSLEELKNNQKISLYVSEEAILKVL